MARSLCKTCKGKVKKNDAAMWCDFCQNWFHCDCIGLSEDQYNHLKELDDDLNFWFCKTDKKKIAEFIKKGKADDTILEEVRTGFEDIKADVAKISGVLESKFNTQCQTFADVLKMNNTEGNNNGYSNRSTPSNGIVVVPKSQQLCSDDVERIIKEKVNLVNIKTGVSKIKHVRNSGIYLATQCDINVLQKEIHEKLGDDFKVFKTKEPKPQLIISGLSREYSADELWLEIKETNSGFDSNDSIEVVHSRKSKFGEKTDRWSFIVEAPAHTYKKMLNRYISVDFNDHFVKQYVEAIRCFNCQQYNHKSASCTSSPVCCRCGRNHKTSECSKIVSLSCINCKDANLKGAKFDTNHSCGSTNCSVHQNILKARQSRINMSSFLLC